MLGKNSVKFILMDFLERNLHFNAALHHKSSKTNAVKYLCEYESDATILDYWQSFGKATLLLYTCRQTINLPLRKNAAVCSIYLQNMNKKLLTQLSIAIKESNLVIWGAGVSNEEKNKNESYYGIVYQLIGSIAHVYGYSYVVSNFIDKIVDLSDFKIATEKDAKTTLQEYAQKKFKKAPVYYLIERQGPKHAEIFKVRVEVSGNSSIGYGKSIKSAEKDSAIEFLKKNGISWVNEVSFNLDTKIDYHKIIKNINFKSDPKLRCFLESGMLPLWSEPMLNLSLTHRSYTDGINVDILGKDNSLLAFIGSYLIQWIAHDAILNSLKVSDITKAGGLSVLTTLLVGNQRLECIFEMISYKIMVKVGAGEKNIKSALKSEFVQAICGVIFLIREMELSRAKDFFYGIEELNNYFNADTKRLCVSREETLLIKSILLERCQSLGLTLKFETRRRAIFDKDICLTPIVYLESNLLHDKLCIQGETINIEKHFSIRNSDLESKLANEVNQYLEMFFGNSIVVNKELFINNWMLSHLELFSKEVSNSRNLSKNKKLFKNNFLGVNFLEKHNFIAFEDWYGRLVDYFSCIKLDFIKATPLSFYEYAGQLSDIEHLEDNLPSYLKSLEDILISEDPLSSVTRITKSKEYYELIDYSTSYKIKSSPKVILKVYDLLEQFRLLSRRTNEIKIVNCEDLDLDIYEISGTHLSLISFLMSFDSDFSMDGMRVFVNDGFLFYTITKSNNELKNALATVEKSGLWSVFKLLIPISGVTESESSITISVPAINTTQVRIDALNIWWSFLLQGASSIAANDIIATMLHSLKNDILGYSISSLQAQSQQSNRDKYQLATDASEHIERALTNLRNVLSISNDTVRPEISLVKIDGFFRVLIPSLWSWIPESVKLDFASIDSDVEIFTNKGSLHSIFVNIVKNSVESMDGIGVISVKFYIDPEYEGIEFLITDTGPGFNNEQLYFLNLGVPVKSSKKHGNGLGLLTIILLVKELNGTLEFFNSSNDGGANIRFWVPSSKSVNEEVIIE